MTSLLNEAVEAHGGLARWNAITGLEAELSITGAIWHVKSKPDFFKNVTLHAATQKQHVVLSPVGASGRHTVFQDDTLALKTAAGEVLERRKNPESSYVGQTLQTPWDDLHGAFFATSALWTYFTAPFLYTYPGFQTEEVEPRHENGEVWRGLQVTFPEHVHSHTRH
ncbi:hypothetical protein ACH4S8_40655 [Streptomyces sp. NPDC021080]|uniref:hypothetical protein n=1 Tax=Streptomyces sp. NPDC021080 TaxID=3365110 RepID=UPI0037BAC450